MRDDDNLKQVSGSDSRGQSESRLWLEYWLEDELLGFGD